MSRVLIPARISLEVGVGGWPLALTGALDGATMGTTWSLRYLASPALKPEMVRAAVKAALDTVIRQMSNWEVGTDITRFNNAPAGSWHDLPAEFSVVITAALELAAETGGAFDPVLGALVDHWGFGPAEAGKPLAQSPGHTWRDLAFDAERTRLYQPGGVQLDLCGIAKGFAVDCIGQKLEALGIRHYLAEIGGELLGRGAKADGQPWWVEFETPPDCPEPGPRLLVALHDMAIATSGDYRRFTMRDGRRLSHTMDPRNQAPLGNGVAAVTVLHRHCMMADALATALSVLGPEAGLDYATQQGIAARWLRRLADGRLEETLSPALIAMLD